MHLAAERRGGVTEPFAGEFHLDPGRLADQLMINTAKLIRAAQEATPVERLKSAATSTQEPEMVHSFEGFGVDFPLRVRLQLGLGTDKGES